MRREEEVEEEKASSKMSVELFEEDVPSL